MARLKVYVASVMLVLAVGLAVSQANAGIASAQDAFAEGDYTTAASENRQVLAEYPDHLEALLGLARASAALGQWQVAVQSYQSLAELGPVDSAVRQEYGDALREAGNLELAVVQYSYALSGAPGDDLLRRASAADDAGRLEDACALYQQVVQQYPRHSTGWRRLAQLRSDLGHWEQACSAFQGLIACGPVSADTRMGYGDALRKSGKLDLAVEQYNMVLANGGGSGKGQVVASTPLPSVTPGAAVTPAPSPTPAPAATATVIDAPSPQELVAEVIEPVSSPEPRAEGGYSETEFSLPVVMYAQAQPMDATRGVMNFAQGASGDTTASADDDADIDWLAEARRRAEGKYWAEAVDAYRTYMESAAVDTALRLEYAGALREARMLDEAMDEYNRVLHADAENLDARLGVAKVLALQGNLEDAMLLLEQLYVDAESGGRAQLTMAYCYFVNGYLNEAFSDIGEVLIRLPENKEAVDLILAGHSATVAGWNEIRAMLAEYPENDEALALLDEIVESQTQLYMQMPVGPFGRAEVLFQSGEYELSQREYEAILRKDPKNIRAWQQLGTLYTWDEDWDEAINAYENYLAEMPNDAEARMRYAQVLLWAGYPWEARDELESLLSDVDVPIDTYEAGLVIYAQALNATGDQEQALLAFEEALMFNSGNMHARLGYADTLAGMNRFNEAIVQYEIVLKDDPTNEAAKLGLARTHAWKGDLKEAQELYDRVNADGGHYVESRVGKAYAYMWEGKHGKANELAAEAARLDPNNPDVALLVSRIADMPDPALSTQYSQSHDSDDNDYTGITTTLSVPLTSEGAKVFLRHEDFKLDNTTRVEESSGTHTSITLSTPLSEDTRVQGTLGLLDIDNGAYPDIEEWTWSGSFSADLSDRATVTLGYGSQVFYDTSWLARTGIRLRETVASGNFIVSNDGTTRLLAHYGHGELSDGNSRDTWSLDLRRSLRERGVGTVQYGAAYRTLSYAQDMNNGYWDPSDYYYSELYADWIDTSEHPLLFDAGIGYGWDEMTGYGSNGLFRYNVGLKAAVGNSVVLRTGYKSSEAPTTSTVTPGYVQDSWYLSGEYVF
jgi:tetratricopeptide (TPR) repeat protein